MSPPGSALFGPLLALAFALVAPQAVSAKLVLVGVDGGSWNLIDRLMAEGELPNLRAIAERGVTGNLASVKPVSSPAVWTSLATGREPEVHGVTHFYVTRPDVRAPTVWERLAARGLRVGLYDWLVTWPPQPLPGGFVIPSWLRRDAATAPDDVFERAGLEPYAYSLEGVRAHDEFRANCRLELTEKPHRFVRLLEAFDLDVAAVTFYSVDACSHRFWDDSFPEDFEPGEAAPDPRYADVVPETLRRVDAAVGQIAATLGAEDTLLIASDHGFRAQEDGVRRVWSTRVEEWVADSPLDPERDGFEISTGFGYVIFRVLPGPFAEREATLDSLRALLESAHSPDGEPLYQVLLLDKVERPAGYGRSLVDRLWQLGLRIFLWWIDVSFDQPAHAYAFGIPQGETLDPLWPDGTVRLGERSVPIPDFIQADDFSGTHHPTGIFLAAGRAIPSLAERLELSVLDLTPLIFYLADQPIPDDLEHQLPERLIAPDHLAAHAPAYLAAAEMPGLPREPAGTAAATADDAAITERLRSLGYVE